MIRNESTLMECLCCGSLTISEPRQWEICSVCGWEDDPIQAANEDYSGGANKLSLKQAREQWRKKANL